MAADLTFTTLATPLGELVIVSSGAGIVETSLGDATGAENGGGSALRTARRDDRSLDRARGEARAYFAGTLRRLLHPVDLRLATPFAQSVYEATRRVPYGELRTYGDIADDAGRPRAHRAAGTALRECPIELWIPCHRIVPAGPGFGTYGGHPERRAFLLRLEGAI